jgi:phosphatidylglycerophosphate synthase
MPTDEKRKVTCYSEGEEALMGKSQEVRGQALRPLLVLLAQLHVTPNHLTLASLLTGLAFSALFLCECHLAAFALLLTHVLLDGLDGPLARFTGRASNQGSFTDTTSDQVVVTFSTITLMHTGQIAIWPGALYLFFYSVVVIFAMVRNALAIPYSWLVRPRFWVYAWMPVELYYWKGSLNVLLWILTALLALKMLTGFVQIRAKM